MIKVSVAVFLFVSLFLIGQATAQDSDETAKLKREVELLKKENELLTREISLLKKENEVSKTRIAELQKSGGKTVVEELDSDLLTVGSRWKGKAKFNNGSPRGVEVAVTERTEKTVKLSASYEGGAVWEFECGTVGSRLKITATSVAKGLDEYKGKKKVAGGTTGSGTVHSGKLTLNYIVPGSNTEPGFSCALTAQPEK